MQSPYISIIVPVYKVEDYLEKCFVSLMNQKFRDFEIVLVDDGSPDNSGKMCDELVFRSEEQGIPIYVIHQTNKGLSGARISGIDWAMMCSGSEWLCFVDSDDTVSDMFIEKLYNAAAENKADDATEVWARAMLRNPRDPMLLDRLDKLSRNAEALLAVGNVAAAAKCYETMVVINPTDASAVLKYGMSLRRLGKKEMSDQVLKRAGELRKK